MIVLAAFPSALPLPGVEAGELLAGGDDVVPTARDEELLVVISHVPFSRWRYVST
jgi:hypothetical protein